MMQKFRKLSLESQLFFSFMAVSVCLLLLSLSITLFSTITRQRQEIDKNISALASILHMLSVFFSIVLFFCSARTLKKDVPWHILAPRAVTCDNLHLRASAHLWHVSAFLCNREFLGISCYIKKRRGFLTFPETAPQLFDHFCP